MSFKDKLIDYRNRYRRLKGKGSKGRFLTRLSEAFGFERKYLVKRDKLHTSYKHMYDKPKTPLERCRESGLCNAGRIAELENLRDKINVIYLVAKIKSLVKTVVDNANNARGAAGLAPQPLASCLGV